jgi:hypothetical protein
MSTSSNSGNSTSLYGEVGTPIPDSNNNVIVRGDLLVLSGNILTTATTGNIFPTNATTINLGLAATAVNIGAGSGTTTINNALTANGTVTAPGADFGNITIAVADDNTITTTSGDLALTATGSNHVEITSGATSPTVITRNTTSVDVNTRSLTLSAQSTGTPAVGFGNALEFQVETAVGNTEAAGAISVTSTDLTPGSEDFVMNFYLMQNGAANSVKAFLDSTGSLTLDNDLTVGGVNINLQPSTNFLYSENNDRINRPEVQSTTGNSSGFRVRAPNTGTSAASTLSVGNSSDSANTEFLAMQARGSALGTTFRFLTGEYIANVLSASNKSISFTDYTNTYATVNPAGPTIGTDLTTKTYVDNAVSTTGVTSITGTANQVIASSPTGAVTLSLPQSIGTTNSPTFAGATLGAITVGVSDNQTITTTSGDLNITAAAASSVNITSETNAPTVITRNSTATASSVRSLALAVQSSGTPTAGFGNNLEWQLETAPGNTESAGFISVVSTDVTPTAEDFKMSFGLMQAGAAYSERASLSSAGDLVLDGDLTVNSAITNSSGDLDITAVGNNTVNITSGSVGPTLITRNSSTTNTNIRSLGLNSQSTGTPATGIGNSIEFNVETATGVTTTGGYLSVTSTDITPGSEDFKMSFGLMAAGATYSEKAFIDSTGNMTLDGNLTVTGNDINSSSATAITLSGANATVNGILFNDDIRATVDNINISSGPIGKADMSFIEELANPNGLAVIRVNSNQWNFIDDGRSQFPGDITTPSVTFDGATSGFSTFTAPATGSSLAYVLPGAAGTVNTVLTNDGSGNLTWALPGGGGSTFGNVTVGVDTDQTISTTSGNLVLQTAGGVNAGTITMTAGTNGAINITPNGTGTVVIPTADVTTLDVTNIRALDGTAAATIANTTGAVSITTQLTVDNININGNTLISTDTNGNITLAPNGTGSVATTFSNGGNITNNRNYVHGAIRNATTQTTNGDIWELNTSAAQSQTNPYFRGVSLDNSADTTRGPATLLRSYSGGAVGGSAQRGRVVFEKARGTAAAPTAVQANDILGSVDVTGYTSTGWLNDTIPAVTGFFGFTATESYVSNTNLGTQFNLTLAPTATTISTGANLISVLSLSPQTSTYRSDTHTFQQGKTGTTTQMSLDVSGNMIVTGDVRINGNDIQGSGGSSAITLTSANTATTVRGDAINLQTAASAALPSGKVTYGRQYIEAYSTVDQTNPVANAENLMAFENTGISNGISIVTNGTTLTRITFANAGIYNLQFSAQLSQTSGGSANAFIWLKKNGANVANTAGDTRVAGNGDRIMAAWNYVFSAAAGDYYELAWSAQDTSVILDYSAASAPVPAVPSVILTVVPVGA